MDESSLEEAIKAYNAQLQQVDLALAAGLGSAEQADLVKLKEDLQQLIELTESSLVSIRKSQLLASLEKPSRNQNVTSVTEESSLDDEFAVFYSELSEDTAEVRQNAEPDGDEEQEENQIEPDEEEDISGTKVCAPYRTSWGTLEYHNALVVCSEEPEGEDARVRVLYLHPTNKSMKPCGFFLEEIEGGFYTVKSDSLLLKEAVLEADRIIPPLCQDEYSSSSDSEDDPDQCDGSYSKGAKALITPFPGNYIK